eukprot:781538-Amphidinium_carterae.1
MDSEHANNTGTENPRSHNGNYAKDIPKAFLRTSGSSNLGLFVFGVTPDSTNNTLVNDCSETLALEGWCTGLSAA